MHLSNAYRAVRHGELVALEGLRSDVRMFFALPIPRLVWAKLRSFQDREFVAYIEQLLN